MYVRNNNNIYVKTYKIIINLEKKISLKHCWNKNIIILKNTPIKTVISINNEVAIRINANNLVLLI